MPCIPYGRARMLGRSSSRRLLRSSHNSVAITVLPSHARVGPPGRLQPRTFSCNIHSPFRSLPAPPPKKKKKKRNSLGCGRNIHVFIWQNINFGALRNGTLSDVPSGVLYSNMDQSTSLVLSLRKQKPKCASFLDREGYVLEDKYDR